MDADDSYPWLTECTVTHQKHTKPEVPSREEKNLTLFKDGLYHRYG